MSIRSWCLMVLVGLSFGLSTRALAQDEKVQAASGSAEVDAISSLPVQQTDVADLVSDWQGAKRRALKSDHAVDLVLVAKPGMRIRCNVQAGSDAGIACKHGLYRAVVYGRDEIASIISPPYTHRPWLGIAVPFAVSVLASAGIYWLTAYSLGVVLLAGIPLGIGAFDALFFAACVWGEDSYGNSHDVLFYQRTGTEVSVKLR